MATLFLESGTDATQSFVFWSSTGGSVASNSALSKTGPRSIKYTSGSTGATAITTKTSVWSGTTGTASVQWNITDLPTATGTFLRVQNSGGSDVVRIRITSGGVLQLWEASAQIGSNGSTLSTGVWNRLCLVFSVTSTTVNTFKLFLNGNSTADISVTNATITNTGPSTFVTGWASASVGKSKVWNVDDIYTDDSSSLTDPGNTNGLGVTNKRPNANGTTNGFTTRIGSGGSGYGTGHSPQVNEQPLSATNGWSLNTASAVTEEYTIEAASVGDVDISAGTLLDFTGWIYASSSASETSQIIVAGVSSNISTISSNALFRKVAGSTSYPGGNTDIGMISAAASATYSLYEAGILFAYVPSAAIPNVAAWMELVNNGDMTGLQYV